MLTPGDLPVNLPGGGGAVDFLAAWHGAQGGKGAGGNEGRSYCSSCGSSSSNSSSSVGPPASKQPGPACEPVACFYTAAPSFSFKGDGVAEGRCLAHVEVSRRSACVCACVLCLILHHVARTTL